MKRIVSARLCAVSACLLFTCAAAAAQQPAAGARRPALDNLSLPSRSGRVASAAVEGWQVFSPEGAGFSVLMPGVPEELTRNGREAGQLAQQFRSYRLRDAGVDYEVVRTGQLPKQLFDETGFQDKFFEVLPQSLALGARERMNMSMRSQTAVESGGYAGREFEFGSEERRALVRVFVVDRALFLVAATGPRDAFSDERARAYVESLAFTR